MAFKQSFIQSAVSMALCGLAFPALATDIHSLDEFGGYFFNSAWGVPVVEVDDKFQNNDFNVELNANEPLIGLHLYAAYSNQKGVTPVENNRLVWSNGQIGTKEHPTDAYLYVAYADEADLRNNHLEVRDGVFYQSPKDIQEMQSFGKLVAAGATNGDMYDNSIKITGGQFFSNFEVTAAYSNQRSTRFQTAKNNSVLIEGADVQFLPYEEFTQENYKEVGEVAAAVYGANVEYGQAFNNSVTIKNLQKSAFSQLVGAFSDSGNAQGNSVTIENSKYIAVRSVLGAQSASYDDVADVSSNNVTIDNSELYFGYIATGENNAGSVRNGRIVIRNSHLKPIHFFTGEDEILIGNVSYISGGIAEGESGNYEVAGNTIELIDSALDVEPWGQVQVIAGGSTWTGIDVHDNTIILNSSSDDFNDLAYSKVDFYGARTFARSYNNSLVLDHWSGSVGSVQNFDTIAFRDFKWESGKVLLYVNGQADISSSKLDVNPATIRFDGKLENHFGEKVVLIKTAGSMEFNPSYDTGVSIAIPSSLTEDSKGVIVNNRDDNSVEFKLEGTVPSRQLELVSNNRNMGLFFVNHGAELILDNLDATQTEYQRGLRTFASVDGVHSNYSTQGHIDVHGFTAAAGVANTMLLNGTPLLLNLFVETGEGDYTEKMSYLGLQRRFSGDVRYYGAGLSARLQNDEGWYAEGSLRAGKIKAQVKRGLIDGDGLAHGYDIKSDYWGAHIGFGHVSEWGEGNKLDLFAKYFYTYLPSDSADIDADGVTNRFNFDSVSSSRVRVGGRVYFPLQKGLWTYTGLAYQYDFTPEVSIDVNGEKIANGASMRGSMGIGSLGLRYQSEDSPWIADLKVRGYVGQREGVSGKLQVQYRF